MVVLTAQSLRLSKKLVFQKHCTRFVDAENALDKPPIEIIYEGMAANTQTKFTPNDSIDAPMI